ncbi:MAG: SEC-C domain-containing protein [Actinobacteria bacterium]|nr:SEC-C domain-containing protein [Actinomycetota bacterium]
MAKRQLSDKELQDHLVEQIQLTEASASSYDDGVEAQAKQLAVRIRVLVHDTKSSKSLLGQLGLKDCLLFYDTDPGLIPGNTASHAGLVAQSIRIGPDGDEIKYVPILDDSEFSDEYLLGFEKWWNKVVIKDKNEISFTRRELVLDIANTDGGAHVDGALRKEYDDLSRGNSTGWVAFDSNNERPLLGVELASIRKIAEELLQSLRSRKFNPAKVGRNDPCPCGSGAKFKRCCSG